MDITSLINANVGLQQTSQELTTSDRPHAISAIHATPAYGLALSSSSNHLAFSQEATAGDDWLKGRSTLYGLDGNDLILGASRQKNVLFGNDGSDQIQGGKKDDVLNGGSDCDRLTGNGGSDLLVGGSGGDRLWGDKGNDTLNGQSGKDTLDGATGNDYLDGGAGIDRVNGGKGNDVLMDYEGGDRLTGGQGADQFEVGSPLTAKASIITDFNTGTDHIKILRLGATFADLTFQRSKGGTVVLDQGQTIAFLLGVTAKTLSANDFVFGDAQLASTLQTNLDQFLTQNPDTTGLASTVVAADGTVWSGVAGNTNRDTQTPVDANSLFSVGSLAKPMTATVILQLRDEGKLSLDDTLSQWLPELSHQIPNSDRITIRQLLNHTSGIRDYLSEPDLIDSFINDPDQVNQSFTTEDLLSYIANKPAQFEPGQSYSYCNTGYILLGEIIEAATGSTVAKQLHQRIFDPLGMNDTFYAPQETVKGNWVQGYIDLDGDGQLIPLNESLSWAGAAGGVVSTSADMAKFSQALFSGELLAPATLNAMINDNVATETAGLRYGSGMSVDTSNSELGAAWGHTGATFVSQGQMFYLPEKDVTVTVVGTSPSENITASLALENLQDTVEQYQGGGSAPEVSLPTLTGEFANGTLTYNLIDSSRDEPLTPDPTDRRQVDMQIWYPSQPGTDSSTPSYLNTVTQALFTDFGVPSSVLQTVQGVDTRSTPDAPLATNVGEYPVIVFSPGLGTPSQVYLTLVEKLASQGYIVVGLNHTDPPEESFDPENPEDPQWRAALQQRVADTEFALDQLEILNRNDPNGILTGRLDLDRVGILGHSFGGATAAAAMREDARFDVGINMDGTFFGEVVTQGLDRPFMLVHSESTAVFDPTQQQFFDNLRSAAYEVTLKNAGHHYFSDLAFLTTSLFPNTELSEQFNSVAPTPSNPNPVPIDPTVALDITNDYLRAFFNQYLKSQPDPLLNSTPTHSAISYTVRNV